MIENKIPSIIRSSLIGVITLTNSAIEPPLEEHESQAVSVYRNKLLKYQAILLVTISILAGILFSWDMVRATLLGGAITMLLTIHMAWRLEKLNNHTNSQLLLYLGAIERFILVLVLFSVGLSLLNLEPLGMITGFIVMQFVQLTIRQQH